MLGGAIDSKRILVRGSTVDDVVKQIYMFCILQSLYLFCWFMVLSLVVEVECTYVVTLIFYAYGETNYYVYFLSL